MKALKWGARALAGLFRRHLILVFLAGGAAQIAQADEAGALSLNGFYTLDASLSRGTSFHYPSKSEDPSSIPLDDGKLSTGFSLVGVQADFGLGEHLRFTLQAVSSRLTQRRDYVPSIEWAYLTWELDDDLLLRGGKFKTPLLQGTELKYVGYSRLWVRPLIPSSGAGGFDDYTGLELIKNGRLGDYDVRAQAAYGVANHVMDNIENRDIGLLSARIGHDQSWVNVSLLQARYDIFSRDEPRRLLAGNTRLTMGSLETEQWFGQTVLNAGIAKGFAPVSPDETMRYVSLGHRFDLLTPYLLYQDRTMKFSAGNSTPQSSPQSPPPRPPGARQAPLAPPPPPPPAAQLAGTHLTRALSLGFRHDLGEAHALKAQVERQLDRDDSNPATGQTRRAATIFSIVLEGRF